MERLCRGTWRFLSHESKMVFAGLTGIFGLPSFLRKKEREARKCALPGCDKLTTHNGGYCCAEHCKQHREMKS